MIFHFHKSGSVLKKLAITTRYTVPAIFVLSGSMALSLAVCSQTLNGVITLQNSGKKPVAGVQIISEGANSAISKTDGRFGLMFWNKSMGDDVFLKVEKEGYEVVNYKDLYTRLREDASDILSIYICPKGELENRKMKYYDIQELNITKHYHEELERLRQEKKDTWEALKALDEQRKNILKYAQNLAERFSVINLDDCSRNYRDAFVAFEKGEIVNAIKLLDESETDFLRAQKELINVESIYKIAGQKIKTAKANRKQAIDCFMLKADLYVINFQFDDAEKYYEKGVNADTTDVENNFKFAYYLQKQNQYTKSVFYYTRLLQLSKIVQFADQFMGGVLNNLALLNLSNNEMSQAKSNFSSSLFIYEKLSQVTSNRYQPEIAGIYCNLGNVYYGLKELVEAKNNYMHALQIRRSYIGKDPLSVAETLNKLGTLYLENRELELASIAFTEALEIEKKELNETRGSVRENMIETLTCLCDLNKLMKKNIEAEQYCKEAYEICIDLSKQNPQKYAKDEAIVLHYLAGIYLTEKKYKLAKNTFQQSVNIWANLAQANPLAYEPHLAIDLQNWANSNLNDKDTTGALQAYIRALTIYRKITPNDTLIAKPYIANLLITMAILHGLIKNQDEAEKEISEAISIYSDLAEKKGEPFLAKLAYANLMAATVFLLNTPNTPQLKKGKEYLIKARQTFNKCIKTTELSDMGKMLKTLEFVYGH